MNLVWAASALPNRTASLAQAETGVDVATFIQWVDAHASYQTALADFYIRRFAASSSGLRGVDRDKAVRRNSGSWPREPSSWKNSVVASVVASSSSGLNRTASRTSRHNPDRMNS